MLTATNIDRRPIFRFMICCTLFTFCINTLSYSAFAYGSPAMPNSSHKYSVGDIINAIMNLFASDACAQEEETPPQNNIGAVTPNVQDFSGSYSQSYPIQAPPGRGGLAPQLALSYSSGRQNGWVGVGWDISAGYIERDTEDGEPGYDDYDNFVLNLNGMSSKLVKSGSEYRLNDEGPFLKIEKIGDYWQVKDTSGKTYLFGYNADSKLNGGSGTFRWYLDSVRDLNNNEITYSYYKDTANNQIYLSQIDYAVDNSIKFVLDPETRTDIGPIYNTYFKVDTIKRLKEIHVKNGSDIVRVYSLGYEYSGTSSRSVLKSIKVYGNDAVIGGNGLVTGGSSLPETTFEIPEADNTFADPENWYNFLPVKDDKLGVFIKNGDFNGDGKMDILYISPSPEKYMVMLSNGSGFDNPAAWHDYDAAILNNPETPTFFISDFNGDGKDDIMHFVNYGLLGPDKFIVMLSTGTAFNDHALWGEYADDTYYSNDLRINDYNGDGKADIMFKNGFYPPDSEEIMVMLSTGTGFESAEIWYEFGYHVNNYSYSKLGDFNGDDLIDIVCRDSSKHIIVMLNNGSGFDDPVEWYGYVNFGFDYSLDNFQVCDFNGDGLADFLYKSLTDKYMVMLSKGNGFEAPAEWHDAVTTSEYNWKLMCSDFNGDSKTDIMYLSPSPEKNMVMLSNGTGFEEPVNWHDYDPAKLLNIVPPNPMGGILWSPVLFLGDFDGNGRTDLFYLNSNATQYRVMKNNSAFDHITETRSSLGAVTEVEYVSSSEWTNEYLPFKLQTVKSITIKDKETNPAHTSTTTYTYQGGKYDLEEKEFRGFEKVTVTDNVTGFVTETHYLMDEIYNGRASWSETKDSLDKKVNRIDNNWNVKDYGNERRFVYLDDSVVTKYNENGVSLGTITADYGYSDGADYSTLEFEYTYTSDGVSKFIRTKYYNDETNWIIGKAENIRIGTSDPGQPGTPALRETAFTFYANGLLHERKLVHWVNGVPIEYKTTYGYDSYGNLTSEADAKGNPPTTINYNESLGMFPNLTTNTLGQVIHCTFDPAFGTVLTETDPNNQTANYIYDAFGRIKTITYPDTSQKIYTYFIKAPDETGYHWTKIESTDSPVVTVYADNFGREVQQKVSGGTQTTYTETIYDNAGRQEKKSLPHFYGDTVYWAVNEYNAQRGYLYRQYNPEHVEGSNPSYKEFIQDGLTEYIKDEKGHTRTITKDLLGRPKTVMEPTNGITDYNYDIFDKLTYVKDPVGNITGIEYDDLGLKAAMDDPYMGHWEYEYDKNGNLIWQQDSKLNEIDITYDALNRIDLKTYHGDNIKTDYTYDETVQNYYNTGGITSLRTIDITNPGNEIITSIIAYNYDNMGRQVKEQRTIDNTVYQTDRKYDIAGRLEYIIYPDTGRTRYNYQYNGMGYLREVRKQGAAYPYINIQDSDYNALGQIKNTLYGNGVATAYAYYEDGSFRLKDITTARNGTPIQNIHYEFDEAGNIEAMDVTTHTNATYTVNHDFTYDEVNRLKTATANCTNDTSRNYTQGYTYDLAGNMSKKTGIGGWDVLTWESDVNKPRIRPRSVRFDAEVAGIAQRNIINNQDQKPVQITYQGETTNLYYDGAGERIKKVKGAETVIYVGGIYEIRNGQVMSHVFANGQKIVTLANNKEYYAHSDHLGSTGVVTDETGTIVEEIGYLPFGATLFTNSYNGSTWASAYRFTGQEFDEEYHLYNYNARLYDPIMSRFITPDTIVPNPNNPQSLNRYSYCMNNPLKYVDPSGHEASDAVKWWEKIFGNIKDFFNDLFSGVNLDNQMHAFLVTMKNGDVHIVLMTLAQAGIAFPNHTIGKAGVALRYKDAYSSFCNSLLIGGKSYDAPKNTNSIKNLMKENGIVIKGLDISYNEDLGEHGWMYTDTGKVEIGGSAWRSKAFLLLTIGHEGVVHFGIQFSKGEFCSDRDDQCYYMHEVQAYDWGVLNADKYGASPDEVKWLECRREYYFYNLIRENRDLVSEGIYYPPASVSKK